MYQREEGICHFSQKLDSGDGRKHPRQAVTGTPLTCEEDLRLLYGVT
jgi:hypothetical protein